MGTYHKRGAFHGRAVLDRWKDRFETAAIWATAFAAAAGLVAGSSALIYFSRNGALQAIRQKQFSETALAAKAAFGEVVGLKRENAELDTRIVGLQKEVIEARAEATKSYTDLFAAKQRIADLERSVEPRTITAEQAKRMHPILFPLRTRLKGSGFNLRRQVAFTANSDDGETQELANQLLAVFKAAGWGSALTPPVLEFPSPGSRSLEGLVLELRSNEDDPETVQAVIRALQIVDSHVTTDYNPTRRPDVIYVRVAPKHRGP